MDPQSLNDGEEGSNLPVEEEGEEEKESEGETMDEPEKMKLSDHVAKNRDASMIKTLKLNLSDVAEIRSRIQESAGDEPVKIATSSSTFAPSSSSMRPRKALAPQEVVDFITLFNNETFKGFKDKTIIFGKTIKIKCHSCIISKSSYFKEEIRSLGENENEIYVADDVRVKVPEVRYITQWFYGKTPVKGRTLEVKPLLNLCRKFQLPLLLRYVYSELNLTMTEADQRFLEKQSVKNELYRRVPNEILSAQESVNLHVCTNLFPEIIHPVLSEKAKKFTTAQFYLICSGGEVLRVHREILVVKSAYFHNLFEKNLGLRDWRLHFTLKPCLLYLMFLYTGSMNDIEIRRRYAPDLMMFDIVDFCGVYLLGREVGESEVVEKTVNRIHEMLDEESVMTCVGCGVSEVLWDNRGLREKLVTILSVLFGEQPDLLKAVTTGIKRRYAKRMQKQIYERVDKFLYQVKHHSSCKTSILVDLKRELDVLESEKRSTSKKKANYSKALDEQKKKNEELQVMIAKSLHPSKYEKRVKELQMEIREKGNNKSRQREMEELQGKIKQLERKNNENRKELKKTEMSLLKLFNETEELEAEISKLQRRIEQVNDNINVVENITIRSFTQPVFQ